MKFNLAWAKVAQENVLLKVCILVLGALCAFLGICVTQLALKDPLVVDRGCYSKVAPLVKATHTVQEIEGFVAAALAQRFDTKEGVESSLLSNPERDLRLKEQKDLNARKLTQRVLVNSVTVGDKGIDVEADRLISVGDIRSAFKFPLIVKIESVARTIANPYGIILAEVRPVEQKDKK